jgi:hypothetical protein
MLINPLLIMLIHILNKSIWEMMEMIIHYMHPAFEKDLLVNYNSFLGKKSRRYYSGTASSDGSVRAMLTPGNGPPLAPSFLSSLASPPVSVSSLIPPPPAVPASSSHYTRVELANVHFVHSLALLEHVACSKQARHIVFPFIINNDKQSKLTFKREFFYSIIFFALVHVKDILRIFIQIMFAGNSGSKELVLK